MYWILNIMMVQIMREEVHHFLNGVERTIFMRMTTPSVRVEWSLVC